MLRQSYSLSVRVKVFFTFIAFVLLTSIIVGSAHAVLYAEFSSCDSTTGNVVKVVNDEIFSIAVCNDIKVFKEFSYCYDVEVGDTVNFDRNPGSCDVVGFTVMRNGVECGALCQ